ncbi:hypothetical protein D210916BOD24_24190 [Alteromonas sp. D210916BOD_24]|uniref:AzlD domain-containing protein n=1 Tax=Alteromonas sp. D210916BOD_24 TaxID=3157618 RepID=UPI00399D14F8
MQTEIWVAIVVAAIGTYALRVGPLLWTQRHFKKHQANNSHAHLPAWLSVLGPLMIAAMLGVSLIPKTPSSASWVATAIGALVTTLVWRKYKTLGLPVFCGVCAFGLVFAAITYWI